MSIPADWRAWEASTSDSRAPVVETDSGWLAHTNAIGVPAGMPAPHSFDAVPGLMHVVRPPGTTFQPWALRMPTAVVGLYGKGGVLADFGAYGDDGELGTCAYCGTAAPL